MNKKKSTGSGPQDAIELVPGVCLQLIAESLFAGTMAGAAVSLLRLGLEKTEFLREELLERAKVDTAFAPVLLALLAGVFLMICLCLK